MATRKAQEDLTPMFIYCRDILEPRWDLAFHVVGHRKKLTGKRRVAEKKRLVFWCTRHYRPFNDYITPTHWLHIDAISILLRDFYKV